jgi:hypothetical protein
MSISNIEPLTSPWSTSDPFIFCAYHEDNFPKGNKDLGPEASLEGRNIGQDFMGKDGWNMYHGSKVPGFPSHPHKGFETVTIVQRGLVDHADSLGAAGRFGNGDVQWMTAGKGVQHSEMFPLLNKEDKNPFLLFQIWLNLPAKNKNVDPYFHMIWKENIPVYRSPDGGTEVTIIAGALGDIEPPKTTPDSWAADPKNEVAIWTIKMSPNSVWELPEASAGINRALFYFKGNEIQIGEHHIQGNNKIQLEPTSQCLIKNGNEESHFLFLQGRPINEPVAQYGPFVMNTQAEIQQAFQDYQRTEFGGWPWPHHDQVHAEERGRFAIHADGREEVR